MSPDRRKIRDMIVAHYKRDHDALGVEGTLALLDTARQWDLSKTLSERGIVVFPHANVAECGQQIAAAVHASLDCGADRILVLSVLHAFTNEMQDARVRVANGGDPAEETHWGIQGTGIDGERQEWQEDHALISWRHFFDAEVKRRGIKAPEVIERYPYLAGGKPEQLPGFDDLARLAEECVIVSTADPFHHGIGYGTPPAESYMPEEGGLELARRVLQDGIDLLEAGDYWGYNQHCVDAQSDARDAGQVFRYLRGPLKGEIVDLTYSDSTGVYNKPPPTWVGTALFDWQLA